MHMWVGLVLAAAMAATSTAVKDPLLDGVRLYEEGNLEGAVKVLTEATQVLAAKGVGARADLVKAWTYKGAALVGQQDEARAKECFVEVLRLQPELRMKKGDFSDRVRRVFEAARTGKAESVMARPNTEAKKAGISVAAIAVVGGTAVLVAGGVAVAGDSSSSKPPVGEIELVSTVPPSGTPLTGCAAGRCYVQFKFRIRTPRANVPHVISISIATPTQASIPYSTQPVTPVATTFDYDWSLGALNASYTRIYVHVSVDGQESFQNEFAINFSFS